MKHYTTSGSTGGFLLSARDWALLLIAVWVASKVSDEMAVAVLREALKSGAVR